MARVLVLYAHPKHEHSRVNAALGRTAAAVPGVTLHDLYETYPDFMIDIDREQALVGEHDVIVFQHPLQWYASPAILKEWQDAVLEEGWAYGAGGDALAGKALQIAITTGGSEEAYRRDGTNRFTIVELLRPCEQTARLCGMRYLEPFITFAAHRIDRDGIEARAQDYRALLERLAAGIMPPAFDSTAIGA